MNKLKTLLFLFLFCLIFTSLNAQTVFWTENFNNGCTSLCLVSSYTGPNGSWTMTNNGPSSACGGTVYPNEWYVSCAENGNAVGTCGSGCGSNATLHIGNTSMTANAGFYCPTGDCGAAYDAGGYCGVLGMDPSAQTDKRAESPVINCTGRSNITMRFKYMEAGQTTFDDATVWYYNGSLWAQLSNPAKTNNSGCGGQGRWTAYSIALPASADNNPNVKIGFRWVNDDDGSGTDPSFAVDDVTLEVPSAATPVVTFTASDSTICAGECINFTGNATNGPIISWAWTFGGGTPGTANVQNPTNICFNTPGTYSVTLTATNGSGPGSLTKTNYIVVTANPVVGVTPASSNICVGMSDTLDAFGASTYSWTPATGLNTTTGATVIASPASTTTYTVTGTSGGCTSSSLVTVNVNPVITPGAGADTTLCTGASYTLDGSGGTTYNWSPATGLSCTNCEDPVATPSVTTTYTVTVGNGVCIPATDQVTVTVNPVPVVSITPASASICVGDSTGLTALGAASFVWSPATGLNSTTTASVMAGPGSSTTYTVTGTTAGCTGSSTVAVTVVPALIANAGTDDTVCAGSGTQLNASGGTAFSWSPVTGLSCTNCPDPVATPPITTTYTVTVSSGSCTPATDAVTITVIPGISANAGTNDTICNGSSTNLLASGGTDFAWSPATGLSCTTCANPVASPTATTTYTVTVTTGPCSASDAITVFVDSPPMANAGPDTSFCAGTNVQLNGSGGGTYTWTPAAGLSCTNCSNPIANPAVNTVYTLSVTNGVCPAATDAVSVMVNPLPVANAGADDTICAGETALLDASGGGSYTWSPATGLSCTNCEAPNANPTVTTIYTVTVNLAGCTASDALTLTVLPAIVPDAGMNASLCIGDSVQLNASGGTIYTWSPPIGLSCSDCPDPMAGPAITTTYTVSVGNGICLAATDMVTVTVNPIPIANISGDEDICAGDPTVLTASGGSTYLWSNGAVTNPVSIVPATSQWFSVTASNAGCSDTDSVYITVFIPDFVDAEPDTSIVYGASVQITTQGGQSWSWQPAIWLSCTNCSNPVATPEESITYTVTAIDSNGCESVDYVTITIDLDCGAVYIPNIFSPNGDNMNDVLYVRGNCITGMDFTIFDRWGEKVYVGTNVQDGWDGIFRGEYMENGVYYYNLKATLIDGSEIKRKGTITLVR